MNRPGLRCVTDLGTAPVARAPGAGQARRSIPHLLSLILQAFFGTANLLQRVGSTLRVGDVGSAAALGILIISPYEFSSGPQPAVALLTGAISGAAGLVAILVFLELYRSKVARPNPSNDMPVGYNAATTTGRGGEGHYGVQLSEEFAKLSGPKEFSYEELMIMTDSFADDRILGRGGFGIVYEGHAGDTHTRAAVKILNRDSCQGMKEYISEVKSLSQLRHRNLVQLVGYCHEAKKFVLVYEFVGGGSLEDHLFKDRPLLTWERRYHIALGLASVLHYLHNQCHQCVIHRDIKSSNTMLDEKFMAKLGDFGLARLVDHARGPKATMVMGTPGYVAPEYCQTGEASKESDVYSFGVILLEIVCGRRVLDSELAEQGLSLVQWVWKRYGCKSWSWCWRRNFLRAADKRLGKNFHKKQAEALMIAGLWCAHPIARSRPSIETAMAVLNLMAEPPKLPSKMPSFNI